MKEKQTVLIIAAVLVGSCLLKLLFVLGSRAGTAFDESIFLFLMVVALYVFYKLFLREKEE